MKKSFIHPILLIFLLGLQAIVFAQRPGVMGYTNEEQPWFYLDMSTRASLDSNKTVLNVYTKVINDALQFVKDKKQYKASYEINIVVLNQAEEQIGQRLIEKNIVTQSFKNTNSEKDYSLTESQFFLDPGTYELVISLQDLESKKTSFQKRKAVVPDYFKDPLSMSTILLKNKVFADSAVFFEPNVYGNISDDQSHIYVDVYVYDQEPPDSVQITYFLTNMKQDTLQLTNISYNLKKKQTSMVFEIPRGDIEQGEYQLGIILRKDSLSLVRRENLSVQWIYMPAIASDLKEAVAQMKYIARGDLYKRMKKAKGQEQARLFKEFWMSVDPTPDTEQNELMQEYYARVRFANQQFSGFRDGWKTDQGMVYIILGPPNEVERHPFETDSRPYEVWIYHRFNEAFVFVDRQGMGVYELASQYWRVLEQLR